MYKAVFADDEIIVREGIQQKVEWSKNGFELEEVFSNGEQVINYIRTHPDIDLVISDICMPLLDGLELSRMISEEFPHIFIVLLTGFDEFEYAQKAIKYNVKEFLLKPITAKEFEEVLIKCNKRIAELHSRSLEQEELKQMVQESLPVLRERFLNRLITIGMTLQELEDQRSLFNLPKPKPLSMIILAELLFPHQSSVQNHIEACEGYMQETDMFFLNKDDQLVCILQAEHEKTLMKRSRSFSRNLLELCNREATIGIGSISHSPLEISESYKDAKKALAYQLIFGRKRVIAPEDFSLEQKEIIENRREIAQMLIESLKSKPADNSKRILASFFKNIFFEQVSLEFAQIQIQLLLGSIIMFLEETNIPPSQILGYEETETILTHSLKSKEDVEAWFYEVIDTIHEEMSTRSMEPAQQKIKQACKYIEEHYQEKTLCMQEICNVLTMSPSYFSAQFKQTTGKTFVEYLTNVRVQHATMLLKTTNLCSYEIAETVGYEDAHYFSLVFKKHTKMTVRAYRKMLNET